MNAGDATSVRSMLASVSNQEFFDNRASLLSTQATSMSEDSMRASVTAAKSEENCGVAFVTVTNAQSDTEYRSTYLLRRGETWKVLVTPDSYHERAYKLSSSHYAAFKKLEQWYEKMETDRLE